MVLTEIGKIEDKKIQEDAFKWVLKGAVKLPEDMYKVEQARELATKAKKDPFSWNTPQACINELLGLGHKVSLKPITIDELKKDPIFSDYRKLPEGVETFEVEDSREGQRRMREVIDTHWGEDANPWCLLARKTLEPWERSNNREDYEMSEEWWRSVTPQERKDIAGKIYKPDTSPDIIEDFVNADSIVDAEGAEDYYYKNIANPVDDLEQAWENWNRYNALPKRVAFKDGKLLAFMATDSMDRDEAFDDASYSSGSRLAEMYPDQYEEYEKWSETEVGKEEGANFYEWLEHEYPELSDEDALRNNVPEQWWDRDDEPHKGIPLGTIAVKSGSDERQIQAEQSSTTGKIRYIGDAVSKKDGITTTWYGTSDRKRSEDYPDGSRKVWHPNGQIRMEERADGSREVFHEDGRPLEKVGADGSKKVWHPNGQIHTDRDSDGNQKVYDETGRLRIEERYDADAPFKMRKYDENGQMTKEILPDSTEREYVDGHLEKEYRSDGSTACFEPGGNKIWERLVDRTYREFDPESGKITMEATPDGSWKRFSPDGEVIEEGFESR
jgi:antitoxin component YwqK of YwqJK toxin-antitoxin module